MGFDREVSTVDTYDSAMNRLEDTHADVQQGSTHGDCGEAMHTGKEPQDSGQRSDQRGLHNK